MIIGCRVYEIEIVASTGIPRVEINHSLRLCTVAGMKVGLLDPNVDEISKAIGLVDKL